ncbi:MAG: hypothetical protein ACX93P_08355 [Roseovarius sp.]
MEIVDRPVQPLPRRLIATFAVILLLLYAGMAIIAEVTVGRADRETAFQKLLVLRGEQVDWVVLGASHALPLAFGDVPERLRADTGQSMAVLAEIGAGPVYTRFVFRQALQDIGPDQLLYVVDSFAVASPRWNEERISDRKLLRKTPLRATTAALLFGVVIRQSSDPAALVDYLTAFSKLNRPDRFSQEGWRGAADFDREVRLSRNAVQNRIDYLYPESANEAARARYLDILIALFEESQAAGVQVVAVKLPLPDAFREALPDEAAFDAALRARLDPLDIPFHDLSHELSDPDNFFDTDHLNRRGVDALYTGYLKDLLVAR